MKTTKTLEKIIALAEEALNKELVRRALDPASSEGETVEGEYNPARQAKYRPFRQSKLLAGLHDDVTVIDEDFDAYQDDDIAWETDYGTFHLDRSVLH